MQTLKLSATSVYTLAPTRNVGELQSKLAKCTGKYKPTKVKADKRYYPAFVPGMSTAEYVSAFEAMNNSSRYGSSLCLRSDGYFAPLNTDPCTLYSGEDTFELVEDMPDIIGIESRELAGAELASACAEFDSLAIAA